MYLPRYLLNDNRQQLKYDRYLQLNHASIGASHRPRHLSSIIGDAIVGSTNAQVGVVS